jgi:hypothetical protein
MIITYGHSQLKAGHPVRSAIHKQLNGRLVLRWVTTWESLLLYILSLLVNPIVLLVALSSFVLTDPPRSVDSRMLFHVRVHSRVI